jgi:hypothetical protein
MIFLMFANSWTNKQSSTASASDRRHGCRISTDALWSNRGLVLDLSRGGARLLSKRSLDGTVCVRFFSHQGSIDIEGVVQWSKKLAFRQHEVGIKFNDLPANVGDLLMSVARAHGCELAA